MYHEPFRPQFHYSPPQKWMNDPNGLVYVDGEYHLFYQYHPDGLVWGPMHWGHAVSPDLIHWKTLPIALYPDQHGTIFSGSVVVDVNNTAGFGKNAMVAVFSYNTQAQGVAYSTDRGRTWTHYAGNPVIAAQAKDFRDPKVFWHEASHQWIMPLAVGQVIQIYTSPNLLDWTYSSQFTGGHIAGVWEVPDLFPLEIEGTTKWVLLVSVVAQAPAGGSGIQYFIGDFDGHRFMADNPATILWMDYGADNYAGTLWNHAPNDDRVYIGWMNNWDYAASIPTSTWRGAMTIPRKLKLVRTSDGLRLAQTPVEAVTTLRTEIGTWTDLHIDGEWQTPAVCGRTLEILAEFEVGGATRFGIDVHVGAGARTRLIYDVAQEQLLINRADVGLDKFNTAFGAPLKLAENRLKLHVLVDESSVEVFANGGVVTMTSQTFVDPAYDGVVLFAEGGDVRGRQIDIYALRSVWR
jgi:fructan beta-fructosidase